jgi:hypothetical protein
VLVHVVGQDPDVRMAKEDLGQALQLVLRIGGARGVGGRVEDQPAGTRRDHGLQFGGLQLEAAGRCGRGEDGGPAGQEDHVGIADPIGRRHDDLVARVQGGHHGVEDDRLAAGRDVHLGGLVGQAVLARELGSDGFLELRDAVHRGVLGLALTDGADRGLLDVVGRVEVRLAGAEADDVSTLGLQLPGLLVRGHGGRRLDPGQGDGFERHGRLPDKRIRALRV